MPAPETPRFGELLRRLSLTKGYAQTNVLDDYFPVIDLLADRPEYRKLRMENSFMGGGLAVGAAATSARAFCMNKIPFQLAVIQRIVISMRGIVTSGVMLDIITAGLPADGAGGQTVGFGQDQRYNTDTPGGPAKSPVSFATDQNPGFGMSIMIASSIPTILPCEIVLRPGYAIVISNANQGAGQDMWVTFWGYARGVEDAELK